MSITDELREYIESQRWCNKHGLTAIADRIDAEHNRMVGCTADEWDYWESTHIELPKDADGEYIHIGDVMDVTWGVEVVEGFVPPDRFLILHDNKWLTVRASNHRHHHAPTVEDVLREFYVYAVRGKQAYAEDVDVTVLADYAKRLRLAEGEEAWASTTRTDGS